MMPPENETSNTAGSAPAVRVASRVDTPSFRLDPPSNVCPCSDDKMPDQQKSNSSSPFSLLRQSLYPVTLKFEDLSYSIKLKPIKSTCFSAAEPKLTRPILRGVTGIARPGELLAMLGPSGSGKTTLLTALAGRLPGKFAGAITYNGRPFSSVVKRMTGFVSQDDVLYPHLTVLETLTYAALLKLPKNLTREEKTEQAELVVAELGLARCRNNLIAGGAGRPRGVSGGERKRVSIGQEMLVNPSLLLLDEPTSGLDSTTARSIVGTLRKLAKGGRTVITTVHQPSSRLYMMFDKVLVLSDGYPIYSGSAGTVMEYFGSIGFVPAFSLINPADFLLDLANGVATDTNPDDLDLHGRLEPNAEKNSTKQSLISSYKKNIYPALKNEIRGTYSLPNASPSRSCQNQWTTSWWMQFKVLLSRGLKERRHESYSGLRIFQVMTVSILSGLLWWHSDASHIQDQVGLLFFFSIFWGFYPLFNATFAFPLERPMLMRERSSGMYHLSSYYFARMAGDLPMELVLPTIFVTIAYWMGGLNPSILAYLLTVFIILLNVLVSQGFGLVLGAILMDVKQATTLASVTMLVFLLAGGYYIQHMAGFVSWLKYVSFSHYCYKLLVGVQYSENEVYECRVGVQCRVVDFPAIKCVGIDNMGWDVAAMAVMLVGYRVLAYVALRMGQPH
ncbi:hypothetical protein NMG60_11036083 [Bertholletia excelsa]